MIAAGGASRAGRRVAATVTAAVGDANVASGDTVLEVADLSAGYAGVPAVRDLSLTLRRGEVVALLGPNGAGKSTTLLAIMGALPLMSGMVAALGRRLRGHRVEDRARLGITLVPDDRGVFHQLTVAENLRLVRRAGPLDDVLDRFPKLRTLMRRRCGLLSGGEQQMLALAKALLNQPRILLIDEMSMGLAPIAVQELLPTIRAVADEQGTAVVLVEQHLDLALSVADRAMVMYHSRVVLSGPAAELRGDRGRVEAAYFGQ